MLDRVRSKAHDNLRGSTSNKWAKQCGSYCVHRHTVAAFDFLHSANGHRYSRKATACASDSLLFIEPSFPFATPPLSSSNTIPPLHFFLHRLLPVFSHILPLLFSPFSVLTCFA